MPASLPPQPEGDALPPAPTAQSTEHKVSRFRVQAVSPPLRQQSSVDVPAVAALLNHTHSAHSTIHNLCPQAADPSLAHLESELRKVSGVSGNPGVLPDNAAISG